MTSAIACVARNEDNYINEFIDYHLALGFNKIFVYCNNWTYSGKKYNVNDVEFIDYPHIPAQPKAYNDFIQKYYKEFDWMTDIDVDEFVYLRNCTNINDFLSKRTDDVIYVRWRLFGDNNLKNVQDGKYGVIDRFTKSARRLDEENFGKPFINLKKIGTQMVFTDPHWMTSRNPSITVSNEDGLEHDKLDRNHFRGFSRINSASIEIAHYRNKTYQESFERRFNIQSAVWGTVEDQRRNGQKFRFDINAFNSDFNKWNRNQIENFDVIKLKNTIFKENIE